jgi:hypothetical protein
MTLSSWACWRTLQVGGLLCEKLLSVGCLSLQVGGLLSCKLLL